MSSINMIYNRERIRQDSLASVIARFSKDGDPHNGRYTQLYRAFDTISHAACEYADRNHVDEYGYDRLLQEGFDVIERLHAAVTWPAPQPSQFASQIMTDQGELQLWLHDDMLVWRTNTKKTPDFDRSYIESCVGQYLQLPYRAPRIDRMLVDLLIAIELSAFVREKQWKMGWRGAISSWVQWGIIIIVAHLLFRGMAPLDWFEIAGLAAVFLLPLISPYLGYRTNSKLINAMSYCYSTMQATGPISARHVREQLTMATQAGVVWPAPVYAMLDDVIARTGTL
jgi:hypothetical protein